MSQAIHQIMSQSYQAFREYKKVSDGERAKFLRTIAEEMEHLGETLVAVIAEETNLSVERIVAERARTTGHCRMFAAMIEQGQWRKPTIDKSDEDRQPTPKPDIRKMYLPLGSVVVFGAANFPLAYSTAGGDTISALAAGVL
jgi:2,5-dioxopentanoate dehydrogenase